MSKVGIFNAGWGCSGLWGLLASQANPRALIFWMWLFVWGGWEEKWWLPAGKGSGMPELSPEEQEAVLVPDKGRGIPPTLG